jgi:Cdc6-like AAA superfamily ATPase
MEPSYHRGAITAKQADFLVGRKTLISDIANRIAEGNQSCVLYGMRGVGKTSIAWQVVSILMDQNVRFKKNDVLIFGKKKAFACAVHRCSSSLKTAGDLFVDLLTNQNGDMRFNSVFASIFEDREIRKSVERKIGVDLLKLFQMSETAKTDVASDLDDLSKKLSDEDSKLQLFYHVIGHLTKRFQNKDIVIVVDEMERPESLTGLGNVIKDIDNVKFLFVGIADTIEGIIKDHKSASRKLSGNDFEAPLLDDKDIGEIYKIAEERSKKRMKVSRGFIDQAIGYSGGVPWIAQHTGYEAAYTKILTLAGDEGQFTLENADFAPALDKAARVHLKDAQLDAILQHVNNMGATEYEILSTIWRNPNGISEEEIRSRIASNFKGFFDKAMSRIYEAQILRRKGASCKTI